MPSGSSEPFQVVDSIPSQNLPSDTAVSAFAEPVDRITETEIDALNQPSTIPGTTSSQHLPGLTSRPIPVVLFNYPPPLLVPPSLPPSCPPSRPSSRPSTPFQHLTSFSTTTNGPASSTLSYVSPFNYNTSQRTHTLTQTQMGKEKERSQIEIILDTPFVALRGSTGSDVEPAVLSGHVNLFLVEDTNIKEVSLHFRGKARIPVPASES
jgi:hypothetical protein